MIRDLDTDGEPPDYDVCIVGSGPAGMVLAAELSAPADGPASLRICVLESGKRRVTPHADALRAVRSEGIEIKPWSRERVLGGASTTWAGLSSPLDSVDMLPRAVLPAHASWPIPREELLGDWARAAARYRFAPLALFGPRGFGALKGRGDAQLAWQRVEEKVFLACSEPQDFGRELRHVFDRPGVDLWLDATVLRLEGPGRAGAAVGGAGGGAGAGSASRRGAAGALPRVERAVVRSSGGSEASVRARLFVLATGGIENARLLLQSTDLCAAGLGNEHDQVGRWLMNHPKNYGGVIRLSRPVRDLPYHFGCLHKGYAGYAGLRLSEGEQRARGLLNCYVRFEPLFPWSGDRGVEAFVFLVKSSRGLFRRWKERRRDEVVALRDYSETGDESELQNARKSALDRLKLVGLVLLHAPNVARYVAARLREGSAPTVREVRLRNFLEMEPRGGNRVTLGEARDAYGQRLPVVSHDSSTLDRRSLVALHEALAEELRRNGFGELRSDLAALAALAAKDAAGGARDGAAGAGAGASAGNGPAAGAAGRWPIDQDASHHMGTTRMGRDLAHSVVDESLRLHTVGNVYAAGASVFPTSGCANPTFTIAALSIRLARHLRGEVFGLPLPEEPAGLAAAAGAAGSADPGAGGEGAGAGHGGAPERLPPVRAARADARRVLVIGAGRRVQEDVLPALLWMSDRFELAGVVARRERELSVAGRTIAVGRLDALGVAAGAADLRGVDLVHVAVSKEAVPGVLARLGELAARGALDPRRVDLLLDTPVLLLKHLRHARRLAAFRNVWVAEDTATLPWIGLARRAFAAGAGADAAGGAGPGRAPEGRAPGGGTPPGLGALRSVVIDRSAWRYHAIALAKTLAGARIAGARRRRTGPRSARIELLFDNGVTGEIVEPRDFAAGDLRLVGEGGSVVAATAAVTAAKTVAVTTAATVAVTAPATAAGSRAAGGDPAASESYLRLLVADGRCRGFVLDGADGREVLRERLDADEQELLGPAGESDTVVSLMPAIKRVGLARMLRAIHAGEGGYPLAEGLDDMAVDALLERLGRWSPTPLTDVRRGLLRAMAGLPRAR